MKTETKYYISGIAIAIIGFLIFIFGIINQHIPLMITGFGVISLSLGWQIFGIAMSVNGHFKLIEHEK